MSFISLKWFGGMVPRRGRQHLDVPTATEAENCNLYSGELRPLKAPALAHVFCRPGDECWHDPLPDDPSVPPDPPDPPPQCTAVAILSRDPAQSFLGDVNSGGLVTLSVTVNADATAPIMYQWYRNGIAVPGEVGPVYSFTVTIDDAYATYFVTVRNPCAEVVSAEWMLGYTGYICLEYACDAMEATAIAKGLAFWPLIDPTFSSTIPSPIARVGASGFELYSTQSGSFETYGFGSNALGPTDPTFCPAPPVYCWKNTDNPVGAGVVLVRGPKPIYTSGQGMTTSIALNDEFSCVIQGTYNLGTWWESTRGDIIHECSATLRNRNSVGTFNNSTTPLRLIMRRIDTGGGVWINRLQCGVNTRDCFVRVELPDGTFDTPTFIHCIMRVTGFDFAYIRPWNGQQEWGVYADVYFKIRAVKLDGTVYENEGTFLDFEWERVYTTSTITIADDHLYWLTPTDNGDWWMGWANGNFRFYGLSANDAVSSVPATTWDEVEIAWLRNHTTYVDPLCQ